MFRLLVVVVCFCFFKGIDNLIVPDEVPSLLSLVYSNIPPIKKGTDSRLGWGFRLGDHADFQVLLELGPQTNTRPLGNEGDKNNKRNAQNNLRNILWAQNQLIKQRAQENQEADKISDTEGGKWLQNWRNLMKTTQEEIISPAPIYAPGEIDASKVIPADLEDLYGTRQSKNIQKISPNAEKSPTTAEIPLEKTPESEMQGETFLAKLARGK